MVGSGEMIASPVLMVVLGKLSSPIWSSIMLQVTCSDDLKAIKSMLSCLQAKLKEAERQSQKDYSVRDALKKLKVVAYDIEDRLVAYESISSDGHPRHLSILPAERKLVELFPWSEVTINLPGEMKKMRERLEEIKNEMDLTSFQVDDAPDQKDSNISQHSEYERYYNCKDTVGRIMEKGKIMDLLLSEEEHFIIPICGLGGSDRESVFLEGI